jgi:hypothetical protein
MTSIYVPCTQSCFRSCPATDCAKISLGCFIAVPPYRPATAPACLSEDLHALKNLYRRACLEICTPEGQKKCLEMGILRGVYAVLGCSRRGGGEGDVRAINIIWNKLKLSKQIT